MGLKLKSIDWRYTNLPLYVRSNFYSIYSFIIKHGWYIEKYEDLTYKLILTKNNVQLSVYLSTMTVQTSMSHPRKGKTQLTRRDITPKEFERLLINPREHTGKGRYNGRVQSTTTAGQTRKRA